MLPRQSCSRSGTWHAVDPTGHGRFFEIGSSLPCSWPVSRAQFRLCHHALDGVPCLLVMRVSQRLECGSHAHDPACVTLLTPPWNSVSNDRYNFWWITQVITNAVSRPWRPTVRINSTTLHSTSYGITAWMWVVASSHGRASSRLTVATRVISILCVSVVTKGANWVRYF
ncbi:MAG: hypothetical protein KatS3mg056_2292 [Chloroflexus sp.]|jgi:hypothetical protein|nr:MAG: hypothetical protein KatS3mg056_2292 [Chloroflexus sp.]